MSIRSENWFRHLMPENSKGRVIVNSGMIVPFNSRNVSAYSQMMLKIAASGERGDGGSVSQSSPHATLSVAAGATTDTGADSNTGGGGSEGGGGGGCKDDGDGDGDGDSDGPRRKPSHRSTQKQHSANRGRPPRLKKASPDRAHTRALIAFTVVTSLLLGTVLVLGFNDQPTLAKDVLNAFLSVTALAAAFLRPK